MLSKLPIRGRKPSAVLATITAVVSLTLGFTSIGTASGHTAATAGGGVKPTVVLVHGAWADSAGWTPVIERLQRDGYAVVAPPNPLRGLAADSQYVASVLQQIKGPVVLAGHSYGGAVITNAAVDNPNVKSLVYIAAFALDQGQSLASLSATPTAQCISPLPAIPSTYPKPDGSTGTELTIDPAKYADVFLDNQLARNEEAALAAEQRPLSLDAVTETSGPPAWQTIPSWYMVAKGDHAICPNLERFMAAQSHSHTVEVGGPHLIMATNPGAVTSLIEQAATSH